SAPARGLYSMTDSLWLALMQRWKRCSTQLLRWRNFAHETDYARSQRQVPSTIVRAIQDVQLDRSHVATVSAGDRPPSIHAVLHVRVETIRAERLGPCLTPC